MPLSHFSNVGALVTVSGRTWSSHDDATSNDLYSCSDGGACAGRSCVVLGVFRDGTYVVLVESVIRWTWGCELDHVPGASLYGWV